MKKFIACGVTALALTSANSHALDQIIRPYQSARSAGMGGVRYTTGLYDENFFGNPARAADNPKWRIDVFHIMVELNSGAIQNVSDLTKGGDKLKNVANTAGTNNHARVQTVFPAFYFPNFFSSKNAVSIGLISSTQVDLDLRKNFSVDPVTVVDAGPAITYARRLIPNRLTVGATARYTYRLATNNSYSTIDYISGRKFNLENAAGEGSQIDFDLGATHKIAWKPKKWVLESGFAVNNVMGGKYDGNSPDLVTKVRAKPIRQPRTFNLGVSGKKENFIKGARSLVAFELTDIGNNKNGSLFRLIHMGGELTFWDWLFVRGGINQGYLTAGVGIDIPLLKIDFATYGEEMSLNPGGLEDRRYALRVSISI